MKTLPVLTAVVFALVIPAWSALSDETRTTFAESVGAVPATDASTVHALAAPELAAAIDFSVALHMRNFAQLKERVARGEAIPADELDRTYLPTLKDYEATRKWLQTEGFTITQEDASRLSIFARGTASQIEKSLQTKEVGLTVKGVKYVAASTAPSLPASVAAPVLGINGLQPYHRLHKHAIVRPAAATPGVTYKVNDILTAYDAKDLGVTGKNQTVAILIDTTPATSDLTKFWSANGVAQTTGNVTTINVNSTTLPSPSGEETLDVEWSSGVAPDAKIRVYATSTLDDTSLDKGLARIISDVGSDATIHQLSISLGLGETYESASQFTTDAQYFATLASKGVSTFVSSGDGGSTPDDTGSGNEDAGPLQVEYYASDPSVTGVGGTTLHVNSSGARSTETAWSGSGGGVSIHFAKPGWQTGTGVPSGAKRFVPDVAMPSDPYTGAYVYLGGSEQTIGGTSWAAPTWAGFCALINEARANAGKTGGMGLLNPSLYPLVGTNNFFDVTTGSNAEGSKAGGKYPATTGYDEVTGIGTPDVAVLVKTLAGQARPTPSPTPPPVSTPTPSPTATPAAPNSLVISQIYGGGGNAGATYANDYIELFNPTAATVDLSEYSVQYASAAGKSWSVTKLTGSIPSAHYYLVSEKGGSAGSALPASDAKGSIALATAAGKVALVSNQKSITGHTSAGVVDFVGYGAIANDYEGRGPAPAPSATAADVRNGSGHVNTSDNAADFHTDTPNPHSLRAGATILHPD